MGIRAEPAVTDQDVAGGQFGMQLGGMGHVVRPQRMHDDVPQESGLGIEQGQQMSHRKPAAGLLVARLAEVGLELGVSGMENPEPSTNKTRWPCQSGTSPEPSSCRPNWSTSCSNSSSGSRCRA